MIENIIERITEVLVTALTGRQNAAIQKHLRTGIVIVLPQLHRHDLILPGTACLREVRRSRPGPACEHVGKTLDDCLVISWDRLAEGIELLGAICVELDEPDGK